MRTIYNERDSSSVAHYSITICQEHCEDETWRIIAFSLDEIREEEEEDDGGVTAFDEGIV